MQWKFQIFVAVAIPLELKGSGAFVAYNFEANYPLPFNQTHLEYPPLVQRESKKFNIERKLVYDALESKIQRFFNFTPMILNFYIYFFTFIVMVIQEEVVY